MPVTVPGPMTKDGVPLLKLYTKIMDDIGFYKEEMADLIGMFCETGTDTQADIATVSMQMHPVAAGGRPFIQHVDTYELDIAAPKRFGVAAGLAADAWEAGLSSHRINQHAESALKADRAHCICVIIDRIFATAGWYGAWMTPPPFQASTFLASHTHYLGYNVGGLPSITIASDAKEHIAEHGGDGSQVVGWINSKAAAALEVSSELANSAIMNTPFIQKLQTMGFTPAFPLAGVPHMINNWIPENYCCYLDFEQKPMYWRYDSEEQRNLIVYDQETKPNASNFWFAEYMRWSPNGGPTILRPNAGVAVRLNSGTYAAPTSLIPTAA